jgi:hypothetical protein
MKKKLIFSSLLLIASSVSKAEVGPTVTKSNGGLLGYKYISETQAEGRHTLTCSEPGRMRCKPILTMPNGDGEGVILDFEYEIIDELVLQEISKRQKEKGKINYNNKYIIQYKYNPDQDVMTYEIYTLNNAKKKGIIN